MNIDNILTHVGETLTHITAASNLPLIEQYGLMPAATLAARAGIHLDEIILRHDRRILQTDFGTCTLNHQKPIVHGTPKPGQSLDGVSTKDWARQLDHRVFFWPERLGKEFAKRIETDVPNAVITVKTRPFLQHFIGQIDFAPINTGNFRQGGANAVRGHWIYVPAALGLTVFRDNRRHLGHARSADQVREISLRGSISARQLRDLRQE